MFAVPGTRKQMAVALALFGLVFGFSFLSGTGAIMAGGMFGPGELTAFRTNDELRAFLLDVRRRRQAESARNMAYSSTDLAQGAAQASVLDTAAPPSAEITNNQEAGVDEGGIVKVRGDMLVILRRGRLFTVSLAGGGMRAIDAIDVTPPGAVSKLEDYGEWYDEMLLSGDRVIVVGYSYSRGGTEINRFRLDADGKLSFEDSWQLRSNDYYSSRNYASRLIGDKLIFYAPLYLPWEGDPLQAMPAVRRWRGDGKAAFRPIGDARKVYIPPVVRNDRGAAIDTLHNVTTCDLSRPELECEAVAVLGPGSRTFYVSDRAVYLWISDFFLGERGHDERSTYIYRIPLDGGLPSATRAWGEPVDQFAFRADEAGKRLDVLVRSEGGDAMFNPEVSAGDVYLLRAPLGEFGDGSGRIARSHYRRLPSPGGESWWFHNRFVGDHVLYGAGTFASDGAKPEPSILYAASLESGATAELKMPGSLDRIEATGPDAVVIGAAPAGLAFTGVDLSGASARISGQYLHPNSAEGESRSHAFSFRPDRGKGSGSDGLLGLPVARAADPALERFFGSSAAIVYLRRLGGRLAPAGALEARREGFADDGCKVSCVDWYGNARPIFLGSRTFALLGYELVEGRADGSGIREIARLDFAPRAAPRRPAP